MKKIIIIGSGILGLTTALELSKYFTIEIYEKESSYKNNTSYKSPAIIATYSLENIIKLYKNLPSIFKQNGFGLFRQLPFLLQINKSKNDYLNKYSYPNIIKFKKKINDKSIIILKKNLILFNNYKNCIRYLKNKSDKYKIIDTKIIEKIYNIKNKYGVLYDNGGHFNSSKLMNVLYKLCIQQNIKFFFNHNITDIHIQNNEVKYIESGYNQIIGDKYILCCGNGCKQILKKYIYVPTIPIYGYYAKLNKRINNSNHNIISIDDYITIKNIKQYTVLSSGKYIKKDSLPKFKKYIKNILKNILKDKFNYKIEEYWRGERCITPDLLPIIDKLNNNLYISCGESTRGMTWSLTNAKILKNIILYNNVNNNPYNINRFKYYLIRNIFIIILIILIIYKLIYYK